MSIPIPSQKNLIGIVVCVNFSDKLKPTLDHNLKFLKKLYVITDPTDIDTFDCVKDYKDVELIISSVRKEKNAQFNKSGLVLAGQKVAHKNHPQDWMVVLDADILLPSNLMTLFKNEIYSNDICYLLKRAVYFTQTSYEKDLPDKKTSGAGFFQLYFNKQKFYGAWSRDAGICDIVFQQRFRQTKELDGWCKHLGENGLDWTSRSSPQWA